MLDINIAIVSSLGEVSLRIISPGDASNNDHNLNRMALLGHKSEEHYHSLDYIGTPSTEKGEDIVDYMKKKHGEGKISEEICPKYGQKFSCLSAGIFEDDSGVMYYYADECYACEVCCQDEEWYSYHM